MTYPSLSQLSTFSFCTEWCFCNIDWAVGCTKSWLKPGVLAWCCVLFAAPDLCSAGCTEVLSPAVCSSCALHGSFLVEFSQWVAETQGHRDTRITALTAQPFLYTIPYHWHPLSAQGRKCLFIRREVGALSTLISSGNPACTTKNIFFLASSTYLPTVTCGFHFYQLYRILKFQCLGMI